VTDRRTERQTDFPWHVPSFVSTCSKNCQHYIRLKVVRPSGCAEVHTPMFLEVGGSPEDGAAVAARVGDDVTPVWRHQVRS